MTILEGIATAIAATVFGLSVAFVVVITCMLLWLTIVDRLSWLVTGAPKLDGEGGKPATMDEIISDLYYHLKHDKGLKEH